LPVLASGVFCFAFFDASILALLPLYGMDKGLNEATAVLLVTVVLTGDAFFQAPLGWVADRFGIRRVHLSCAVVFASPCWRCRSCWRRISSSLSAV
jgi:MFS family permease